MPTWDLQDELATARSRLADLAIAEYVAAEDRRQRFGGETSMWAPSLEFRRAIADTIRLRDLVHDLEPIIIRWDDGSTRS